MLVTVIEVVLAVAVLYFTIIRQALKFPKHKDRLFDIFAIGLIMYFTPHIMDRSYQHFIEIRIIGGLIFHYGFALLIVYSFLEGYNS